MPVMRRSDVISANSSIGARGITIASSASASLGTGHLYRKQALQRAGLQPGMTVLDMACGTGAVTRAIVEVLGGQGRAMGVDPSSGMLAQARAHVPAEFHEGHAEALPFTDASFDFLSMGYALRHVGDLHGAFAECRRVLKAGGRLLLLEITKPRARIAGALARFYFRTGLPLLTRLSGGDRAACEMASYFWETIDACVPPDDPHRPAGKRLRRGELPSAVGFVQRISGAQTSAAIRPRPHSLRAHGQLVDPKFLRVR